MKQMEKPTDAPITDPNFTGGLPVNRKPIKFRGNFATDLPTQTEDTVFDFIFNHFGKLMGGGFCLAIFLWLASAAAGIGVVGFIIWCIIQVMQHYGII